MKLHRNQENLEQMSQLVQYAFNKPDDITKDPLFLSRYQHGDCYGIHDNGQLSSALMVNHFKTQLFQSKVKMAGIGYVASYPESRGRGDIGCLLKEVFLDLKEHDVMLSQLAPFSEGYYRKYGYENTSYQKKYTVPSVAFSSIKNESNGSVRRGSWQELKGEIKLLYQVMLMNQQAGTLVREDWWWERLNNYYPNRFYMLVYDDNGVACGYLIYRMEKTQLLVDEMMYVTGFALRKILTYLKSHRASIDTFIYLGSTHEQLDSCFSEQHLLTVTLKPYMMSRIINFQQLLTKVSIEAFNIILEVTEDSACPWNIGRFNVEEGVCKKVEREGDVRASIQSWTELLLGEMTLEQGILLDKIWINKRGRRLIVRKGKQSFYDYF